MFVKPIVKFISFSAYSTPAFGKHFFEWIFAHFLYVIMACYYNNPRKGLGYATGSMHLFLGKLSEYLSLRFMYINLSLRFMYVNNSYLRLLYNPTIYDS